jgi:phosphohistidine phosphatase SixA
MRRALLAIIVAAPATFPTAIQAQAAATVVILVRHAEKAAAPAADPPLTDAGTARARLLASALRDAKVDVVVSSQFIRTRETARPIAEAQGLIPEVVAVGSSVDAHARDVAAAVRKHTGKTVLVVGHSNTVPQIVAALGGPAMPDICDAEYSAMFTLVLEGTSVRLLRSNFGEPSDTKGECARMRMGGPPIR